MAQASWSGRRFLSPGARRLVEAAAFQDIVIARLDRAIQ
jgi:hypothetical protein